MIPVARHADEVSPRGRGRVRDRHDKTVAQRAQNLHRSRVDASTALLQDKGSRAVGTVLKQQDRTYVALSPSGVGIPWLNQVNLPTSAMEAGARSPPTGPNRAT
jgi:hypothetical protein